MILSSTRIQNAGAEGFSHGKPVAAEHEGVFSEVIWSHTQTGSLQAVDWTQILHFGIPQVPHGYDFFIAKTKGPI